MGAGIGTGTEEKTSYIERVVRVFFSAGAGIGTGIEEKTSYTERIDHNLTNNYNVLAGFRYEAATATTTSGVHVLCGTDIGFCTDNGTAKTTFKKILKNSKSHNNITCLDMEIDGDAGPTREPIPMAAVAADAAARAYAEVAARRDAASYGVNHQTDSNMEQSLSNEQVMNLNGVNSFFKQCSVEKLADRHTAVHSISATGFVCEKVPVPRIGSMAVDGEADITKLFHGARKMRGGQQRNDVMTSTFDPATLNCVTCKKISWHLGWRTGSNYCNGSKLCTGLSA
jgi:hypothetical protein